MPAPKNYMYIVTTSSLSLKVKKTKEKVIITLKKLETIIIQIISLLILNASMLLVI